MMKKLQLDYFIEKSKLHLDAYPLKVEFIDVGVMNYVYRVTTDKGIIYFKQALHEAKYKEKIGVDLASIPPGRIQHEFNFYSKIVGELAVPEIYEYDSQNNVLILKDAGSNALLLDSAFKEGVFNDEIAANIGRFLGKLHSISINEALRGHVDADMDHWKVMLAMRTININVEGEVKAELTQLYDDVLLHHTSDVMMNNDCCPKNIYQKDDDSITMIDFELCSGVGDTAYDVGFIVGHYILSSVICDCDVSKCVIRLLDSYEKETGSPDSKWTNRMVQYAGATMFYRLSGSSTMSNISKKKVVEIKIKAEKIILECKNLNDVKGVLQ